MKYKITEQYLKGEERFTAECLTLSDASFIINRKSFDAQEGKKKIIYRLYQEDVLVQTFNKETISLYPAKYAEGDAELEHSEPLSLSVIHKDECATDHRHIANFAHENDAVQFIIDKCQNDPKVKESALFSIFKDTILIKTYNKKIILQGTQDVSEEKGACYRPTPLATRAAPPGFPVNCWIEEEEADKTKK